MFTGRRSNEPPLAPGTTAHSSGSEDDESTMKSVKNMKLELDGAPLQDARVAQATENQDDSPNRKDDRLAFFG